ncbi:MAG: hypothetical protein AAF360_09990 [Pseudomonadota bacterium]
MTQTATVYVRAEALKEIATQIAQAPDAEEIAVEGEIAFDMDMIEYADSVDLIGVLESRGALSSELANELRDAERRGAHVAGRWLEYQAARP